jgi:hypothetical protein
MPMRYYAPSFRGAPNGSRKARPDDANPESRNTASVWIPGPREDACPGMTKIQTEKPARRGPSFCFAIDKIPGAGEGIRTLDPDLGKVVLYH